MLKGLLPGGFSQLEIGADLAAKKRLQAADQIPHETARANRNAAHDAELPYKPEANDVIRRRDQHGQLSNRTVC
jgi:hypothetical protein